MNGNHSPFGRFVSAFAEEIGKSAAQLVGTALTAVATILIAHWLN